MENKDTTKKSDAALREEAILQFWKENKIFSKTLSQSKGKKEFVFYEGPPTANGKPGIHYLEVWNKFTKRIGYWLDQEHPYVTYENNYIESVWNVVKKVNDQKLLYKDYKVVPWCPRCGTALSSHELAQGYEDVKDLSVYVKFKVKGQENT